MGSRPTALVTGASSGIGAVFADRLAASGHDLVLVARDGDRLRALAGRLTGRYGGRADVLVADLTEPGELATVERRCAAGVTILVNNAGFGTTGRFVERPVGPEAAQVQLHCAAVLRLTHAALPAMLGQGHGAVVNVASVAGLIPAVSAPTYGATKAFEVFFSESLAEQLRGSGVRIQALCPGLTRTEFHDRAEQDVGSSPGWVWLSAERVVDESLRALARGTVVCVPGRRYRALVAGAAVLPRSGARRLAGALAQRRSR
ncbi:MAG TPA: SDR family oxidoreductase [Mycobacteriales bacterium]|jgi:short-subunit dehydrogenase|nr:SDR family oxidoreductase [Mycobacteriales bacterium]